MARSSSLFPWLIAVALSVPLSLATALAEPVFVGVLPKKLSITDQGGGAGKLKLMLADGAIDKGDAPEPATIASATYVAYDGASTSFEVPAGAFNNVFGWISNDATSARFLNRDAPDGPTRVRSLQVRTGSLIKLAASATGEVGQSLDVAGEGAPTAGVSVAVCIANGGEEICHCATAQTCKWKETGSGAKLSCKGGVADPACAAIPAAGSDVACADLPEPPSGPCEVTAGDDSTLLLGDVLAPLVVYRGGQVLVDATGLIACVGCDCADQAPGATRVSCPGAAISPALVNPHEHLGFAHNSPAADTGERYEHRHDWRLGLNGHTQISTPGGASINQIRWGELRHLLGGATSIVGGSNGAAGLLRNLDSLTNQGGLEQDSVEYDTFPLGDNSGPQVASGCDGYPSIVDDASIASEDAYAAHVAEGIDAFAANEFSCLSTDEGSAEDVLEPQSAFIHALAVDADSAALMAAQGTALIWSPRSNIRLYGNTAQPQVMKRLGVQVALGTDWTPSGSMNMLRELRCAADYNDVYLDSYFSSRDLWEMATISAAAAAGVNDVVGSLRIGREADISIFSSDAGDGYDAVVDAEPKDVLLVLRSGTALYGDSSVVNALASGCDALDVCGQEKRVCMMSETGMTLAQLSAAVGAIYPAFACGVPPDEPTCTPSRSVSVNGSSVYDGSTVLGDVDGDGISDGSDNCVQVFNPVMPVDDGVQRDADGDGEGDACDLCPLSAGC
ncbi:MAG TPA: amidohydrolase family protein [Candidatus Limnocylindrales bacterium]|nr:amidohydrolase family protein [Candidatus Limnocylindrales bacterium]